jgi:beta-phosphoglucomutase-like phosphatase (HAD superfamily)
MKEFNLTDFDGLIFDLEGTLADTIPTHHATRMQAFQHHGFGHITREEHELGTTYGSSTPDILGGILHAAGDIDVSVPFHQNQSVMDVSNTKAKLFKTAAAKGFDAMPGAIDFIKMIAPYFVGKMAIVSSSEEEFIFPFVQRYNLEKYFPKDHIIGHESVMAAGLQVKPSGDPFVLGMQRIQAKNVLVFEDTISGTAAAKKAHATVIALGFDAKNDHLFRNTKLEYPPDAVVANYAEAAALFSLS